MREVAYDKTREFEDHYWWFVGRRKIVKDTFARLIKNDGCGVVVEFGCGTGATLEVLEGPTLKVGVDRSLLLRKSYSGDATTGFVCGDIVRPPVREDLADIVLLLDVIEHVDGDREALRNVYRICRPGARIIITVPAFRFLWSGEDVISMHKRRYVRNSLQRVVMQAGFSIEQISYFNFFLMPGVVLIIFLKKIFYRKALQESNLSRLPRVLNLVLASILSAESRLLRYLNFPFGSSIICVAKK